MPKLLFFAVGKHAIIDRDDNTVSLIAIFSGLDIKQPVGQEIPPDASAAIEWAGAAYWYQLPEDIGKTFEQRIQLLNPSGDMIWENVIGFEMTKIRHTSVARGSGIPVMAGEFRFVLSLRETNGEWSTVSEYPVNVNVVPVTV